MRGAAPPLDCAHAATALIAASINTSVRLTASLVDGEPGAVSCASAQIVVSVTSQVQCGRRSMRMPGSARGGGAINIKGCQAHLRVGLRCGRGIGVECSRAGVAPSRCRCLLECDPERVGKELSPHGWQGRWAGRAGVRGLPGCGRSCSRPLSLFSSRGGGRSLGSLPHGSGEMLSRSSWPAICSSPAVAAGANEHLRCRHNR